MNHKKYGFLNLVLVAVVALTWACEGGESDGTGKVDGAEVLANVDGYKITQGDVEQTLKRLPPHARSFYQTPQAKKQLVESLVTSELLYKEALDRKIDKAPDVSAQIDAAKRGIYARFLMEEIVKERTTDSSLRKKYEADKDKYSGEQVKAAHILIKDEKKAMEIHKKVVNGGDFAELAKENSEDPSNKNRGGELGWFTREKMVKPFSDAAFTMKEAEISKPVKTQFGYHIIMLQDRRSGAPFEEVKERIKADLQRTVRQDYIEELKKSAKIEYFLAEAASGQAPQNPFAGKQAAGSKPAAKEGHEGEGH